MTLSRLFLSTLLLTPSLAFAQASDVSYLNVQDDRYVVGGTVTITQPVLGDLFVAGGNVTVRAPISGDVHALGGTVHIESNVADTVRVAGGNVMIAGDIGGSVLIASGDVSVEQTSVIGGDMLVTGGILRFQGTTRGNARIYVEELTMNGRIDGTAEIRAERTTINGTIRGATTLASKQLTVAPQAAFIGKLTYWTSKGEMEFGQSAKGGTAFNPEYETYGISKEKTAGAAVALFSAITLFGIVSGALIIALFMFAFKTLFKDAAKKMYNKPTKYLLWGFLYLALAPIACIVLLISIIGIPLALVIGMGYMITLLFVKPMTALMAAYAIQMHYKYKWDKGALFGVAVLCLIVLKIVAAIPFLGFLAAFVLCCSALGAVIACKWERFLLVR